MQLSICPTYKYYAAYELIFYTFSILIKKQAYITATRQLIFINMVIEACPRVNMLMETSSRINMLI